MTTVTGFSRPRLIYWVHVGLMLAFLLSYLYLSVYTVTHLDKILLAQGSIDRLFKLGLIFVVSPITIALGLYCIGRVPGNIVAPILVMWGSSILDITLSGKKPTEILAVSTVLAGVGWPAIFFLFSYFPDSKVYPPRFEKWLDRIVLLTYGTGILSGFTDVTAVGYSDIPNPAYIAALVPIGPLIRGINFAGAFGGLIYSGVSLTLRFRAADLRTRQQIKWLLWGLMPILFWLTILMITGIPSVNEIIISTSSLKSLSDIWGYIVQSWLMIFPVVAIGNAILRHRLYDIDIIIRRTLVYSVLTGILVIVYLGSIVLVQQLFRAMTGQSSDLAIVISTLTIAALFTPLRRRVQNTIDRRLYRRKYNAEQTLEGFNQTLRDEVDLETLKAQLIGVVQDTMQPDKIALWVRSKE
jgi:hypothetical protein